MVPRFFPSCHITKRDQGFRNGIWFPLLDKHMRRCGLSFFFFERKKQRMRRVLPIGPTSVGSSARKEMQLRRYNVLLNT